MNSSDIINWDTDAFDTAKYYQLQKKAIVDRVSKFSSGRLYLEIGGKFLYDPHANRVLPGFDPKIKQKILADLVKKADILFCVDFLDIIADRQLKNTREAYIDSVFKYLDEIYSNLGKKAVVVINRCRRDKKSLGMLTEFEKKAQKLEYKYIKRYMIAGYPDNSGRVLSIDGFGADDYLKDLEKIVIVTGAGSNSGKMSTCLGQIYNDSVNGLQSGYAKYELFPIWNLDVEHPVNLAYEAATADIGDYNVWDELHEQAYGKKAVNYNRDTESYKLIKSLTDTVLESGNYMHMYNSPTDMGINMAGECITDDLAVCKAAVEEIRRRAVWYREIVERGDGKINWISKCFALEKRAVEHIKTTHGLDI